MSLPHDDNPLATLAIDPAPVGAWAIGVSGGADSVGLLRLLHGRAELRLHVAHLNHETRGQASIDDAQFVQRLARQLALPCTIATLSAVEANMPETPVANRSARYRAARMALFRRVVDGERLQGVLVAHHADDQAETILHRLLRGAAPEGLAGMRRETRLGELRLVRPLLHVRSAALRQYLNEIGQDWREDASNASDDYARNRIRKLLGSRPELVARLLELSEACAALREWSRRTAPRLADAFAPAALASLPPVLARESARRWLVSRDVPAARVDGSSIARLIEMATDAASPPRQQFPGAVQVARRQKTIWALHHGGAEATEH